MSFSWLPFSFNFSFPDLSPPLSIQRRFISFLLKRSLGHLLKPGQLDVNQIDAQIGSGFVEVKDLELDPNAINSILVGQPIQLHSGTLASVTARIPWPNPFSSVVGLSLSGLRLNLRLVDRSQDTRIPSHVDDLAESVASVAESFIHDELTANEEAQLRRSIHQDQDIIDEIPGSMSSFLSQHDELPHKNTSDPEGISIFARLFETLLARFDFDASDSQISLIHNGVTLALNVARIHYFTTSGPPQDDASDPQGPRIGERRSVHVSGIRITTHDQTQTKPHKSPPPGMQPRLSLETSSMEQESSDSELDDDTNALMSQSLAFLPPRTNDEVNEQSYPPPDSGSASPESSIYKSAISTSRPPSPPHEPAFDADTRCAIARTILSITETIILQLTTPPVISSDPNNGLDQSPSQNVDEMERVSHSENMKLDVSLGVVAILLDARTIRGLLSMVDSITLACQQCPSSISTKSVGSGTTILDRLDVSAQLKGLVSLVVGEPLEGAEEETITQFFERPLATPSIMGGYVRIHVDLVKFTLRNEDLTDSHTVSTLPSRSPISSPSVSLPFGSHNGVISCIITDFSVLVFHHWRSSGDSKVNRSSPLLITDRHLENSYRFPSLRSGVRVDTHTHPYSEDERCAALPAIDVMEWYSADTYSQGASLRHWRTRATAPHKRRTSGSVHAGFVSNVGIPSSPTRIMRSPLVIDTPSLKNKVDPAVSAQLRLERKKEIASIGVEIIPLHLFLDLELVRTVSQFMEYALPDAYDSVPTELPSPISSGSQDEVFDENDDIGKERKRLEKLVLEDLNLDLDYLHSGDATPKRRASPTQGKAKYRRTKQQPTVQFDALVPLIRIEIRVPPPQNRQPRSGILVLDVHSARLSKSSSGTRQEPQMPRFESGSGDYSGIEDWFSGGTRSQPISLEMRRVVVAYSALGRSAATTIVSLGPVGDSESRESDIGSRHSHLLPLVFFRNSEAPGGQATQANSNALVARVPSLHAVLDKKSLDGLQLWVDDLTQFVERLTGGLKSGSSTNVQVSRTGSLIGSRYFIRRTGSGSTESEIAGTTNPESGKSELVIKFCLSEAFIRLVIPSSEKAEADASRSLNLCASDLDALVEFKPEGKDETVISLNIRDVNVVENSATSHEVALSKSSTIDDIGPAVFRLRFRSVSLPGTVAKESKVRMVLNGLIINLWSDMTVVNDILCFVKAPPGAFESVIPSERTQISIDILDCACRVTPPSRSSAVVLSFEDVGISTDLVGESHETALGASISALSVLLNDDTQVLAEGSGVCMRKDTYYWTNQGYALLAEIRDLELRLQHSAKVPSSTQVILNDMLLNVHLSADTISGIAGLLSDLKTIIPSGEIPFPTERRVPRGPTRMADSRSSTLLRSLDEDAFRRQPVIGPLPDMINDDLPENPDYLDASFGAAAGLRPLEDDEEEFNLEDDGSTLVHGGETIKMLHAPIEIVENYFDTLTPSVLDLATEHGEATVRIRAQSCDVHLFLYDGYDWERTRKVIREEVKRVRRRLAKIRQLLASGQTYDPDVEEVNSVLFNSVYVGLEPDAEDLEGDALMAAIDDELADDTSDLASESSWQSFNPARRSRTGASKAARRVDKLDRSREPSIEFSLRGMTIDYDRYLPEASLASRLLSTIKDLEILDHMKTSTWSTFLTELRTDSRGDIRETDSNMVRVELQTLQPFQAHNEQEARLKAKILPLRLHVDQDALDFLKKFFSFKDADAVPSPPPENEIFFQHVEIFPVDIKLDYKPRRVDYKALKEGKTIELMNFFHFDGSEMTLRHLTLKGVTGWAKMFDLLNDLWTPDVKANQLVDVISGVSPIRSAVNVGSGIADLVLLPIAQYKKDGRVIRGLQKGATAFMKSTAMEAIRLGARLATGTQVVLEQTENVLGAQFSGPVTAEALQSPILTEFPRRQSGESSGGASAEELYSRYAEQPTNVREGVESAYRSLSENIKYAGQTILAVPMEVYERSGTEGPARAVIRAVPIAVLKPMIGASEAISKTLLGLHNTLDPQAQIDTEAKYKHR